MTFPKAVFVIALPVALALWFGMYCFCAWAVDRLLWP